MARQSGEDDGPEHIPNPASACWLGGVGEEAARLAWAPHCQRAVHVNTVHVMPYPWTADDLLFALVRAAHLEPSQRVADGLLSAADRPGAGLAGVTPLQARLRAAEVLLEAGRTDDAMAVARDAVRAAGPDTDGSARMQATFVMAAAGAADETAGVALEVAREHPGVGHRYLISLSLWLAANGRFPQATRLADEAVADVARMPGSDGKFHYNATIRELDKRAGQIKAEAVNITELSRENVLDFERRAAADGTDPVEAADRRRREIRREAAAEIAAQRPWPALADDRLVWWPSAEYSRLVRQVPDLTGILGGTWREHTALVESFMSAAVPADGAARLLLAHADFDKFTAYLEHAGADPRPSPVQTAFTRHAGAGYHYPARWPPDRRYPCWCGSHRKYPRCCGSQPATSSSHQR